MNNKLFSMLGLAMRAGKIASGAFQTQKALADGKAKLLVIDSAMSEAEQAEYRRLCSSKALEVRPLSHGMLESAIGKPGRMAAAITDDNFARQIITLIDGGAQ